MIFYMLIFNLIYHGLVNFEMIITSFCFIPDAMILATIFVIGFFALLGLGVVSLIVGLIYLFTKDENKKKEQRDFINKLLRILAFLAYVDILAFILALLTKDPSPTSFIGLWTTIKSGGGVIALLLFIFLWYYFDSKINEAKERITSIENDIDGLRSELREEINEIREELRHIREGMRDVWKELSRK